MRLRLAAYKKYKFQLVNTEILKEFVQNQRMRIGSYALSSFKARRNIFPTFVLGSSLRNSTYLGRL